jgi:hypothetical protein
MFAEVADRGMSVLPVPPLLAPASIAGAIVNGAETFLDSLDNYVAEDELQDRVPQAVVVWLVRRADHYTDDGRAVWPLDQLRDLIGLYEMRGGAA